MGDTRQYICMASDGGLNAFKQVLSGARISTCEEFTKHNLRKGVTLYDTNLSISTHCPWSDKSWKKEAHGAKQGNTGSQKGGEWT